jgi:O-antigen/teichoic acid export membrane protein
LVVLVALTIPFGGLASTVAVAQAKLRPEVLGILNLLQSLLWTTAVLGLVVFHSGTLGLAAGFVVTTAVSSVLSWVVSKRICAPLFSGWRRMAGLLLREGWMLGLMGVAVTAYYRLDAVLVYRIAGSAQAGLYAAAYRFLDVAQLLPGALLVPLLPLASRTLARGGHGEARRVFERVVIMALVISLPVAIGLSVHGAAFISLIYGQDFAQAAPVTAALGWAFVGVCFGWAGTTLTVAARRVRSLWPVAVGVAVASLVTHVVAIRWFGALGAGWVTAATELVIGLAALHIAGRAFGTAWPWDRLARVGLSGLVLALTAIFVRGLPLPIAIGLPGAAYLLALPGFGAVTSSELRQLLHGSSANAVSEG